MDPWLQTLGRLHPLLLHLPIGAVAVLVAAELWERRGSRTGLARGPRAALSAFTALTAIASAATGWFLAEDMQSGGTSFEWHRNLGIALAATLTLAALFSLFGARRPYGFLLVVSCLVLLPTGHLGGEMTHGAGFLTEPLLAARSQQRSGPLPGSPAEDPLAGDDPAANGPAAPGPADPALYETAAAPFFASYCVRCHGDRKRKGDLALDALASLSLPGASGTLPIEPGSVDGSEVVRRLRLPLEDDEHMPPPSKPQPTPEEIAALEAWIAGAEPAPALVEAPVTSEEIAALEAWIAGAEPEPDAATNEPPELSPDILAALREEHVHVERVDPERDLLWVDFGARPSTDDSYVRERLAPLVPHVIELDLARSAIGDDSLTLVAGMLALEDLDLSRTGVTSDGITALADHTALRSINLTATNVDDGVFATLASLPALERAFLADTGVGPEAIAAFEAERAGVAVFASAPAPARALEAEPPVVLGIESPLDPINATCPVSGTPVDPAFRIVFADKVIAFCCDECPTRYWAAPDDFPLPE